MALYVRPITEEESETLEHWQRADNVVGYRRARIVRLSAAGWTCPRIGEALGLHAETVRAAVQAFNEGDLEALTPLPRAGGR